MSNKVRVTPVQDDILQRMYAGWTLTTIYGKKKIGEITNGVVTLNLQIGTVSSLVDRGMIGKKQDKSVNFRVVRTWKLTARGEQRVEKRLANRGED